MDGVSTHRVPPGGCAENEQDLPADLAFVNGQVATMDRTWSVASAIAMRGERIVALGDSAVRPRIAAKTEVIDLRRRLVLPGFQDGHVHPIYGGLRGRRCDVTAAEDVPDYSRHIGEYSRTHPEESWLLGGGWELHRFRSSTSPATPAREWLDSVTGRRPAYLVDRHQHSAWVNSAALDIAGIDRYTSDPAGGWVERDQSGEPTGLLHETATELVARHTPPTTAEECRAALLDGQRFLHAHGVTTWHDAIVGSYLGYPDTLRTYVDLDEQGLLTGRVRGALWWDSHGQDTWIDELKRRRAYARGQRFRCDTVKIMQDGVCENFTAAMLSPYLGGHGKGMSHVDSDSLARAVGQLDAEGFQVHFHAVGDRAVRDALDAVASARNTNGTTDRRHQIAHAQVVHPDDRNRFRALGVAATIQARWAVHDADMVDLTIPYLGSGRAGWQYPFRSLHASEAVLAAGSDWPVSELDPLLAMHVAVHRRDPDTDDAPFLPTEALSLTDALAAYTRGTAWVNHLEHETGSLELGKAADCVVLDRNFSALSDKIADAVVDLTVARGQIVYARP